MTNLSEQIARWERQPEAIQEGDLQRVAADLHHNHLPRLDEADIVEYDARSRDVRYRPHVHVERVVQFVDELE